MAGPGPIRKRWGICRAGGAGGGGRRQQQVSAGGRYRSCSRVAPLCCVAPACFRACLHQGASVQDGGGREAGATATCDCQRGAGPAWRCRLGGAGGRGPTSSTPVGPRLASLIAGVGSPGRAEVKDAIVFSCCSWEARRLLLLRMMPAMVAKCASVY